MRVSEKAPFFIIFSFAFGELPSVGSFAPPKELFVRLLHKAIMAPPKRVRFAPFPVCLRTPSI